MRGCFHQFVGKLAVISQQQQTFTGIIQTSNRINSRTNSAQKIHDGGPALGIAYSSDVSLGLIH